MCFTSSSSPHIGQPTDTSMPLRRRLAITRTKFARSFHTKVLIFGCVAIFHTSLQLVVDLVQCVCRSGGLLSFASLTDDIQSSPLPARCQCMAIVIDSVSPTWEEEYSVYGEHLQLWLALRPVARSILLGCNQSEH